MGNISHQNTDLATLFGIFADRTRLRLVSLLLNAPGPLCVCEMEDAMKEPQYRVSRHIGVLRKAGIVRAEKNGTWNYYFLRRNNSITDKILEIINNNVSAAEFMQDKIRMEHRLALRAHGRCVIGHIEEEKFQELLQSHNNEETSRA